MEAATMAEPKAKEQNDGTGQPLSEASSESNQAEQKEGAPKGEKIFPHEQAMKDNGLEFKDLPTDLKMGINAWNMQMRKYKKTPSDNLIEGIKKTSIKFADTIQNIVEKDFPEKTPEQIRAEKETALKAQREEQEKKDRIRTREEREGQERERLEMLRRQKEKREMELKRQQEEANAPERKVMEIVNAKGKIHYKELKEILGQNVGDTVRVGNLVLLNVPFTNSYKPYKSKE